MSVRVYECKCDLLPGGSAERPVEEDNFVFLAQNRAQLSRDFNTPCNSCLGHITRWPAHPSLAAAAPLSLPPTTPLLRLHDG